MNANLSANEQGSLAKTSYGRHRHSELKWQRVCIFTNDAACWLMLHIKRNAIHMITITHD